MFMSLYWSVAYISKARRRSFGLDFVRHEHLVLVLAIAKGRNVVVEALLGAFLLALGDLGGQVLAVPVGHRFHDALDERTHGAVAVLGRFGDRKDLDAIVVAEQRLDGQGIGTVAGKAVEFVDDQGVELALTCILPHLLEGWAVGGASGFGFVLVDVDQESALTGHPGLDVAFLCVHREIADLVF